MYVQCPGHFFKSEGFSTVLLLPCDVREYLFKLDRMDQVVTEYCSVVYVLLPS